MEGLQTTAPAEAAAPPGVAAGASTPGAAIARESAAACPECEEGLLGDYCQRCGEKRPEARDLSVRHFVQDAAQELTSLDSKVVRTLLTLLTRPGSLTNEWVRGRRGRYLKPLNLCLGIFAVNLFAFTATKQVAMFDIGLILKNEKQTVEMWHLKQEGAFGRLFARSAASKGVPVESLESAVSDRWQRNVSLLQPAQILLLALLLQAVYLFSRRYFVEHLVFSMHFLSFAVLTTTLLWPVYYLIGIAPTRLNMLFALSKFAVDILYLFLALRAVYGGRTALALLRALVVFAGYFGIYVFTYIAGMFAAIYAVLLR